MAPCNLVNRSLPGMLGKWAEELSGAPLLVGSANRGRTLRKTFFRGGSKLQRRSTVPSNPRNKEERLVGGRCFYCSPKGVLSVRLKVAVERASNGSK